MRGFWAKEIANKTCLRLLSAMLVPLVLLMALGRLPVPVGAAELHEEERSLTETVRLGFYDFSESIDISRFQVKPEKLTEIFSFVIKNDPYLFFVDARLSYSYRPEGHVLCLKPRYVMSREETEAAWDYCRDEVRRLASLAGGGALEKALFLHDLVCRRFDYDETLENDNIYAFLRTGKGTCQAYTLLYMALLGEVGIGSVFAASDTIAHIWNLVLLDGQWYHADLTWDDAASKEGEKISHRHFLLSDRAAEARGHRDWYAPLPIRCESEQYVDCDLVRLLHKEQPAGDADHDGMVTLADLLLLRKAYGKRGTAQELPYCCACTDPDRDGRLTEADLVLLRRKLLQLELTDDEK